MKTADFIQRGTLGNRILKNFIENPKEKFYGFVQKIHIFISIINNSKY
ncbi:hypothetical protein GbCGDNIH3_5058 [Granulibacter bethesdensis]|uniref:Uncharacterized protein n=1 Tax=Granulibacter bethesdensis TaxID=364410 RepID=A0AAN0REW6_9PROT|nr:hypothetical protein GbCGDNIH3_5058 [Granulibacter bethesdensis]